MAALELVPLLPFSALADNVCVSYESQTHTHTKHTHTHSLSFSLYISSIYYLTICLCLPQLLKHIESTSPECVLYPGVAGLDEPAPVASKTARSLEGKMVAAVQTQSAAEAAYAQGISRLAR